MFVVKTGTKRHWIFTKSVENHWCNSREANVLSLTLHCEVMWSTQPQHYHASKRTTSSSSSLWRIILNVSFLTEHVINLKLYSLMHLWKTHEWIQRRQEREEIKIWCPMSIFFATFMKKSVIHCNKTFKVSFMWTDFVEKIGNQSDNNFLMNCLVIDNVVDCVPVVQQSL